MRLMTLDNLIDGYSAALARLESWGVRVRNTRLDTYLKLLERANGQELQGEQGHQDEDRFRNAIVEASEIIDIAQLHDWQFVGDHVTGKLKQISEGREFAEDEGADAPRDYAFEFASASELDRLGRFGGFSIGAGDVLIAPGLWPMENKRISSLAKVAQRVRGARDQLQRGFESGEPPGIIALDLTRPIRRVHGHLSEGSDDALLDSTSRILTAYVGEHLMSVLDQEAIAKSGVLGITLRLVSVGTAGDRSNVRRSTASQLVSVHHEDTPENELFLEVASLCSNAPIVEGSGDDLASARASIFS